MTFNLAEQHLWKSRVKGEVKGCGIRDWYLTHVSHNPHITFPLPSYTLDVCTKVQIKP